MWRGQTSTNGNASNDVHRISVFTSMTLVFVFLPFSISPFLLLFNWYVRFPNLKNATKQNKIITNHYSVMLFYKLIGFCFLFPPFIRQCIRACRQAALQSGTPLHVRDGGVNFKINDCKSFWALLFSLGRNFHIINCSNDHCNNDHLFV